MGIKKTIKKAVRGVMGKKHISFRKPLKQIGLESLSFAELIIAVEDIYGIELFNDEISRFLNLNALVAYVKIKVGA